jgi:hypothetical protein
MAIACKINDKTGIVHESAYIRVNNVEVISKNDGVVFRVRGFVNQQAFIDKKHFIYEEVFTIPFTTEKVWSAAYEHLKTLPEFEGAVDC